MTEAMTQALTEMQRDRAEAELVHVDNLLRRVLREAHLSQELAALAGRVLATHAKDMIMEPEDRALCLAPAGGETP